MLLRRTAIPAALVILLLLVGAVLFWLMGSPPPFSSPTAIRTNPAYQQAHAPAVNLPPFAADISSAISIQRDKASLTVSCPSGPVASANLDYGPIAIHRVQATEAIQIGDGSIRLAYVASATKPPPGERRGSFNFGAPAQFYTADLKPITRTDPLRLHMLQHGRPEHLELVVQRLPGARFIFACSNIAGVKPIRFRVFDARTHYTLSTSYHQHLGSIPNTFIFNTDLNLWHQTPLELVGTVATGPTQTYTLSPVEGAEATFPGGAIKLLAISEDEFEEASATSNSISFRIVRGRMGPPSLVNFSLMFFCWPRAYQRPVDFEFYDDSGRPMRGLTRAVSDRIVVADVTGSPEQLKEIRLKHYPNLHRLVVTIPELPGLPEENRNLTNLFDVHVPYARFQQPNGLQQSVGDVVQMQMQYIPFSGRAYSNTITQRERTNITARALLEELDGYLPSKNDQLICDEEKSEIRYRRYFLTVPLNFVRGVFSR